ncbi:hypothetical protein D9M69_537680 [compost metagenome]
MLVPQLVAPIGQLPLLLAGLQPTALPQGIVAVLDRQRRQSGIRAGTSRVVETQEFVDQQVQRPAVGDDMVQGEQQDVLPLRQLQQPDPQQRPLGQVEGGQGLRFGQRGDLPLPLGG